MLGSGFIKNVISTSKNNHHGHKGEEKPHFQNFDRKSYISKNRPHLEGRYKEADPQYLEHLRKELQDQNTRKSLLRKRIFLISTSIAALLFTLFYVNWI